MKIELIVQHLQQQIGMNPEAVGFETMRKAVYSSMLANEMSDLDKYYQLIQGSSQVMQELIDAVVIPETSFFRDKKPFEVLKNNLQQLRASICEEGEPLKILSIPSSTGEEPYSIAITCLEAGLSFGEFKIDACDISQRVLNVARSGAYGSYSFRGCNPIYQQRYFTHNNGLFQIEESLRTSINFFQGNLISDTFLDDITDTFHIVFCRNLLIYFDRPTKYKAVSIIDSILHDQGLLVVGHADTSILPSFGYERFSDQFSFTYTKKGSRQKNVVISNDALEKKGKSIIAALVAARTNMTPSKPVSARDCSALVPVATRPNNDIFQEIELLLKESSLSKAIELCHTFINERGDSSIVYHYLGRIALLNDDMAEAEAQFKKAIYLQPGDEKALHYLAQISEKCGDKAAALRYQQRADRIKARIVRQQER